jgi:KaiC/GvpD/RAD55 family RecA-like ATPase
MKNDNPNIELGNINRSNHPTKNSIRELNLGDLLKNVEELISTKEHEDEGLLKVQPANRWIDEARLNPVPKMLFGEFWLEGELCIHFADTNLGKSILAVQIADSITRCKQIIGFKLEASQQPVIYIDFEQSSKQFQARYSIEYSQDYRFSETFYRAEINPNASFSENFKTFEEYLYQAIEKSIEKTGAKVLIIDNITYLRTETEKAKDALPLMKELKTLKKKYGLSILVLAHTPKRDSSKPITRNDLQGSKMLINFCDSAFAMGESAKDVGIRYLKQIKQRNTSHIYGPDNVCICQISKPHNFLQLEFIGYGAESVHLKQQTDEENENLLQQILERHREGESLRQIGTALGISHMKVSRMLPKGKDV